MTTVNYAEGAAATARKPQQRRLATYDALVAAARAIVETDGVAALRTEDVVRQAGTAKGTFFAHFPDREHLVATLVAQDLMSILSADAPDVEDLTGLRQALAQQRAVMAADLQVISAMIRFSAASDDDRTGMAAALCHHEQWIADRLDRLQARGAIRQDHTPDLLAQGVHALVLQSAIAALCDPRPDEERFGDLLAALLAKPD